MAPKYSKRNKGIKMIHYKIFNTKEDSNEVTGEQKDIRHAGKKKVVTDAIPIISIECIGIHFGIVWTTKGIHIPLKRHKLA